jgi:GNAT superfamily N-acetyltransferase
MVTPATPSARIVARLPLPDPSGIVVRPLRRRDLPAVVDLRRLIWPDDVTHPEAMAWDIEHPDPGAAVRRWVATYHGLVVGFAVGGLESWTTGRVGFAYLGVQPAWRGRGIGGRLFATLDAHLEALQPSRTLSGSERDDEASARFLRARGFHRTRHDQAWSVDPRTVSVAELPERRAAAEARGLRLVPMRALLDRPEDIYGLNHALERDLPSDVPIAQPYSVWRVHELETPLFAPDASFCLLAGDEPIAMTWIMLDADGHRARHGMTGTLRAYRHQGLARLVKLASMAWLAQHGVTALFTDNDTENRDMLALNEHLGFQPLTVFALWAREAPSRLAD